MRATRVIDVNNFSIFKRVTFLRYKMNFGTYVKFEGPYFDMFMSTRVNFMLVVTSFRGKLCGIYGGSSHGQVVKPFS